MNKEELCAAFCERIAIHEVPIGYAIRSPLPRSGEDPVAIYARRNADDPSEYRLEDDGATIAFLEASGADLDSETRFEAFAEILRDHNASYSEEESLIHSSYAPVSQLAQKFVDFSTLLSRVFDITLLASNRVRSTFKDDLIALVEAQFGSADSIEYNVPVEKGLKDYVIDIVVRNNDGRTLAIYAGTSELKALEALLFSKEAATRAITAVRTMLVLEKAKPPEIKERTLSRVMNSSIVLAAMDGEEIAIKKKMAQSLEAAL